MKKWTALFLVVIMLLGALPLSGCTTSSGSDVEGAAATGYAFIQELLDRNYEAAYEKVYSFTSDVQSRQDFVDRFTNIYDALEISDIELLSRSVTQTADSEYQLNYSLRLESGLLGTLDYDYEAQIVKGPLGFAVIYTPALILPMLSEGDKVRVSYQEGDRGEIFTADGKLLAKNDYAETIYLDMEKDPDIEEIKDVLSELFDADEQKIQKRYETALEKEYPLQVLLTFPRNTITAEQSERLSSVRGLGLDDSSLTEKRYYPMADNTAHITGYLGSPTEDELAADETLTETSLIGRTGLEQAFESDLRGNDGWLIYIEDGRGEVKEVLYEDAKTDGSDVYVTIDSTLQNKAYTLLQANCKDDQSGCVIVMDYKTGDIKAMVNYPSFDPNLFNPTPAEVWKHYSEDPLTPMFSRCTQADYMPGSTFKMFTAVPAIEAGKLDEDTHVHLKIQRNDNGTEMWNPGDDIATLRWSFPYITRVSTPSDSDFENAVKSSDNIFFAYYALLTGIEPMKDYLDRLGIGDAPDFELPVRKSSYGNESTDYNLHWLAQTGYGIGVSVTPLQMASMYTALMNDGDIVNPTIVSKVSHTSGSEETVEKTNSRTIFRENVMSSKAISMAKTAMRRVILDGTAYAANLGDLPDLMAKTGTAQYDGKDREMNWIICINPGDGCVYLVMVDAKTDEGTRPKLAILNGLLKPAGYSSALQMEAAPGPAQTPRPGEVSAEQSSSPQTTAQPEASSGSAPEPVSTPEPVQADPEPTDEPEPDGGDEPEPEGGGDEE
ncbi:MAG: hypothetical protein HDQ87_07470 [Clostridia bacterium]|nr:hypothetical protein [Clostridia bacterium]